MAIWDQVSMEKDDHRDPLGVVVAAAMLGEEAAAVPADEMLGARKKNKRGGKGVCIWVGEELLISGLAVPIFYFFLLGILFSCY